MEDNLAPILLFKVHHKERQDNGRYRKQVRGVYYVPQKGVAIEGHISDGSVRSIARHIAANTSQYVQTEGVAINPHELTEEAIERSITSWIQNS